MNESAKYDKADFLLIYSFTYLFVYLFTHFAIFFFIFRRSLRFELYTADQVHLLPGFPSNSSGSLLVAFYVQQPLGLFIANFSVLPNSALLNIVLRNKPALQAAIGANILRVEAVFKPTASPPDEPVERPSSSDTWKWIVIGVSAAVVLGIVLLIVVW